MTSGPSARLLDLTRLIRRADRRMTGVDRVEFAYLEHLLTVPEPLYGLVRTSLGYLLLDFSGCAAVHERVAQGTWGPVDLPRRLHGGNTGRRQGEADARRLAIARCLPPGLGRMLRRHLPERTHYLNTGHSNLTARVLRAVRQVSGMRIGVLVHDTIPLDFPQYQRAGTARKFAGFLQRLVQNADVVICNSAQTRGDVLRHAARWQAAPSCVVAHLGVPLPVPGVAPEGPWEAPYFVALGTIEPRKNHALLLDLWDEMGATAPHLVILGARGWENHDVFARLDRASPRVHELSGLQDGAVFALLAQSAGLLFPSHAEGYGLPPVEAAALGVPVICSDLAVCREVLGNIPIYAKVTDRYLWRQSIIALAKSQQTDKKQALEFVPPDWQTHFNIVLRSI
ncbi:glycosyltransferase family 4 protein [Puniceibacterium confluentis]|uniref:glycosyltransferase family 4 protein n=1 Tax=Puniceibacterium confluentis TaxID=1958944 RepID=UPI0011B74E11|nr:glycosyltransferase family 1 protein [Puniceibacterium confluentis]